MTLHDLLEGVEVVAMHAPPELSVRGLHYDSRRVLPGQLFFALAGLKTDGLHYAREAMQRGAVAIASAAEPSPLPGTATRVPWVQLAVPRRGLAQAAANFYAHPSRQIEVTGVTGTNGKTTTSYLLYSILAAGNTTGLFGTIEYRLGTRRLASPHTTPESVDLQAMLADLRESGGTHAVMEVSSHALALERVYATRFQAAVFTNLTRDHLDYHGTMEEYFAVKRRLFDGSLGEIPRWAVLNADDPHSAALAECGSKVLWYGLDAPHADVRESGFLIHTPGGSIANRNQLIGRTNSYNRLAAVAAAVALGIPKLVIEEGLESLTSVPGRFESVDAGQPFRIIVDYAHTDGALRNVLATARGLKPRRIITVFGCGGDRDRKKRPLMGEAAGRGSDFVIVTSDNPRSEDPRAIIEEILPGLRQTGTPFEVEPERGAAITMAIREAQPGDLVLLAGKGHETSQVIGNKTISFDDRQVARQAVKRRPW